ncbi:kelch-like protein [Corallococcus sp. CA049B]|uniref:Kelch repeat-containing protein n=1 Tax=Corallococcus sp. CA049B TaxID=2316730 RepID=UPI000EA02188|nr:kelch repeat-containing protein [Corallococcus sp. CA049B]RKG81634.1 kelch-like protein [Corallococcus sp. CA049B]
MKRAGLHLMLALAAALLAGCGATAGDTGTARFSVSAPQSLSSTIARVAVASGGPDIRTVWVDLAPTNGVWGGTIGNIPAGTGRAFAARAYDASGTLLFSGSADGVSILANQTTLVAITLQQVNPPPPFDNEAPIIDFVAANPSTVAAGGTVSLFSSAHDPNPEDTISYTWSATAGSISSPSERATTWTAPTSTGIQTLTLTVTDSRGLASSALLVVNVLPEGEGEAELSISFNSAPEVSSLDAAPTRLVVGQPTSVSVTASDPDGDTLAYAWSASCAGTWTDASTSAARFTPSLAPAKACNNCRLSVSVSDGRGGHNTGTVALCVTSTPPAQHLEPVILRSYRSSDTAIPGQKLTYEVAAMDPQGSALTFAWGAAGGELGPPTEDGSHSRITWTAPSCVSASSPPFVIIVVINAFNLTATRRFPVTGLPICSLGWVPTGSMSTARWGATATLLLNGKVLVAGGENTSSGFETAELYDSTTGAWSPTGSMNEARVLYRATLLPGGSVLVTGGMTAERYDPATGAWSVTGPVVKTREFHTATLLPDGKVLVAGGFEPFTDYLASAEVYDPATNTWSPTGPMTEPRENHTATLLLNGKVLVSGGSNHGGNLTSAELYDPATGTWSSTGSMAQDRSRATATLLSGGKVLVAVGFDSHAHYLGTAELYDPASGTWSPTGSLAAPRFGPTATLLRSGEVLIAGGADIDGNFLATAELYDPATGMWRPTDSMPAPRFGHTATLLSNGQVLVAGGVNNSGYLTSAELYRPFLGTWSSTGASITPRLELYRP